MPARKDMPANAAATRSLEKVGDHWEPRVRRRSSDAPRPGPQDADTMTVAGVNAGTTRHDLLEVAKRLEVRGRSRMSKQDLLKAIRRAEANRGQPLDHSPGRGCVRGRGT
jgi:hypothetical protein